ncbi:MAG: cell wall hydrolase [Variibacter sp.]|nr:cell wall hydrolase [Variibacter sp.]
MVALRRCLFGAPHALFGLSALFYALGTTQIGRQDLAALIARQPTVSDRAREHLIASPFGTIHASVFSLPRPIGTLVPPAEPVMLAKFDPTASDLVGHALRDPEYWLRRHGAGDDPPPDVNRAAKGDLLIPRVQIEVNRAIVEALQGPAPARPEGEFDEIEAAVRFQPFPEYDIALSLELHPQVPAAPPESGAESGDEAAPEADDAGAEFGTSRLYFEGTPMAALAPIEPWGPGEAPVLASLPPDARGADGEAAKAPSPGAEANAPPEPRREPEPRKEPVTVAAKGEAPEEAEGLLTPAMRLRLAGKARAKAERCLANAIYFEARGESVRGQIAVAQVVLNRVFSGYYPRDICGVVYQGAHRHLSCQFTFACDGIPDVVTEPEAWARAKRIAAAALDGKVWLKEIGKATHYHAYWVNPYWVRSMRRLHKIGVHSFYRPRRWGDGSDAPVWGHAANAEMAAKF